MNLNLLVVAGDGIGPEVTAEAVAVLNQVAASGGHTITITEKRIGGIAITTDGVTQITSATSLSFTPANYNIPQIVTVVAPDDGKWEPVHTL